VSWAGSVHFQTQLLHLWLVRSNLYLFVLIIIKGNDWVFWNEQSWPESRQVYFCSFLKVLQHFPKVKETSSFTNLASYSSFSMWCSDIACLTFLSLENYSAPSVQKKTPPSHFLKVNQIYTKVLLPNKYYSLLLYLQRLPAAGSITATLTFSC
jgi:hypothetical protein